MIRFVGSGCDAADSHRPLPRSFAVKLSPSSPTRPMCWVTCPQALAWQVALLAVCMSGKGLSAQDRGSVLRPHRMPAVSAEVKTEMSIEVKVETSSSPQVSTNLSSEQPHRWLASTTATASHAKAQRLLDRAKLEYQTKAWLSAESSAWETLAILAQAIDLETAVNQRSRSGNPSHNEHDDSASVRLRMAKNAIMESRDFGGAYAPTDSDALLRLSQSHRTQLVASTDHLTSMMAADRYLDLARRNLAPLAGASVRFAETLDLLAAIYLSRDDAKQLPSETALCLRRAALQGQPENADLAARLGRQLAEIGLDDEAGWALEHSLRLDFQPAVASRLVSLLRQSGQGDRADHWTGQLAQASSQTKPHRTSPGQHVPVITQLSPQAFAALSPSVMPPVAASTLAPSRVTPPRPTSQIPASLVSAKLHSLNQSLHQKQPLDSANANSSPDAPSKTNKVKQWFQSIKKPW